MEDADLELQRYLRVLFAQARASMLIELRWRAGADMHRRFVKAGNLEMVAREARRQAESADVFVGVLPRCRPRGDRRSVADDARTVWVDLDFAGAAGVLEAVDPRPHLVVASGGPGHVHAYWSLAGPVAPLDVERANRSLAWALGGDLQCTDAPRILRPPGTIHHARGGVPVRLIDVSDGPPTTLAALVSGLPDPPLERPRASRRPGHGLPARDPLLAVTPERYVQVLTGQTVGRSRKVRCPLHELSVGERGGGRVSPARSAEDASSTDRSDPLLLVPPPVYFERLTGLQVGPSGKLHCLFHDDRSPSLHVYREPERGWFCFGCRCGGSVYDLAALLFGLGTRGRDFVVLRRELEQRLL